MSGLVVRLILLTIGLGVTEIALTGVFNPGGLADWLLLLIVGLPLLVGGTLGFLAPILGTHTDERTQQ